ncbi:hypothetical protein J4434_06650 [Candidatus Woesearchaeota archaeon]|nr:hypothetical protein [Candidatus Woesearchaeota archaeon]
MPKKKKLYGKSRTVPILKSSLQLISWIMRGKMRKFVFQNIEDKTMPSDIVERLVGTNKRKPQSHYVQVSRALAELEIQGLLKCLNPKEKTGRFYQLTIKGKELLKML